MRSGLRRFLLAPLLINISVFVVLIWFGASQFESLMEWLLPSAQGWWAALARGILWVVFAAATGLLMFFAFTMVANLIAAPFNGLLAERVERVLGGRINDDGMGSERNGLGAVVGAIVNELRKLRYFLIVVLFPLVLTLIPVINVVAPFVWLIITAWILALEYLAYPMENHGLHFSEVRRLARANIFLTLGFGAAVMAIMVVPVINLTVIPASVAGATAMWVDHLQHRRPRPDS